MFGNIFFLSDKIVDSRFCDCEDECLRDRWRWVSIRFVLHFEHVAFVFCWDPSTFGFERLSSCVKIALIANRVFSKNLSRSIYTSFMIECSGNQLTPSICGRTGSASLAIPTLFLVPPDKLDIKRYLIVASISFKF